MENTGNMSRGNMLSGAEAMVRMLQAYDVKHIFGLCGDTTLPFYDALARLDHDIVHYLTRDERHAAYMADGYARVTGKPGICDCLLYTSPSPRDRSLSRMPSSA